MQIEPLIILENDLDLLKKHCKNGNLSDFNRAKLSNELANAKVIKSDDLPEDVVCVNSEIEFKEVDSGQRFAFHIVPPNEANIREMKMSVFAPLSIALLGYRKGARVEWEMPAGLKTFEILKVIQLKMQGQQAQLS